MNYKLLIKMLTVYFITAISGFIAVSFISYKFDYARVSKDYSQRMYKQATLIANTYATEYITADSKSKAYAELMTIASFNETRILIITTDGNCLMDTGNSKGYDSDYLYSIVDFDYGKLAGQYTFTDRFYGVFNTDNLYVYAPITSVFTTNAYVVVAMPYNVIEQRVTLTSDTNYIILAVVLLFSSAFIFIYLYQIHVPIVDLTRAAKEYGKGNYKHTTKKRRDDELGQLTVAMNYMASKLDESEEFQQKFLSNISHDFRSPLTSIKGYLEAIQDGTIPPDKVNHYIDTILFETDRLTKLTNNIISLNELDPNTVRLDITTFDINDLIKHTVETFEGRCTKRKIRFDLTFSSQYENVSADKMRIGQVIYNLVDNAIKFSKNDSIIYISVKQKPEKVYVSVKDTGQGIDSENINKIWDRFYKSDASRGKDKKGSGLGLSITKEVITAHNETIDVISTLGAGTEFVFTLKRAK